MSLLQEQSVAVDRGHDISIRILADPLISPTLAENLLVATHDLMEVGMEVVGLEHFLDPDVLIRVRRISYGSPYEVVFLIGSSAAACLALAKACSVLLNALFDSRVKLATARKIIAETDAITTSNARRTAASDWRVRLAGESTDELRPKKSPLSNDNRELFLLALPGMNGDIQLDEYELEAARTYQAGRHIRALVAEIAAGNRYGISEKEIQSLLLLSGVKVEVEVLEGN